MPFLKRFYHHFLKLLLIPLVLSVLFVIITTSNFANGFLLGTIAAILMSLNWYYHLEQSYEGELNRIKLGTITRILIVVVTCFIWYRFAELINIFGVISGIALVMIISFSIIVYRAMKELPK